MLRVSRLSAGYGAIPAVREVDIEVAQGTLVALIGSNGAGKTTTLNTIAGLHKPSGGTVTVGGRNITGWACHRVVRSGVALVAEGRRVAPPLTVLENLELSAYSGRGTRAERKDELARVFELFPRLADRKNQFAASLSGGEQQMLAFGRALMTQPQVLLLDEPSMGLAPSIVDVLFENIETLHNSGATILLVEQNAELALEVSDEVYVMQRGRIVSHGTADEVRASAEVMSALFG
ncbi:ABC transporter ATP-binding protein [Microbacterium sp. SLBN-146]|uniref:ABC transporter ATP-binding protein n=1 Tax=Microbacterium sp. SLBN-146 TaxID=2768457 RepID=UPI001153C8A6|nr:ABC transporter ATP-binding protein [Microbacterium sp. SLBN-146]TQJ29958.1 amino acid/amide ABC transporter ATP-binding protein 2 (HAAT family) [Microbacterium sp. SLBN-146]